MDLVQDQTPTLDLQTLSDISFYSILIQKLFFTVINEVSGDIRLAFFIFFGEMIYMKKDIINSGLDEI